jgi:hypothetical protein
VLITGAEEVDEVLYFRDAPVREVTDFSYQGLLSVASCVHAVSAPGPLMNRRELDVGGADSEV